MNQICLEKCHLDRKCSAFEIRKDLNLIDLPSFPVEDFIHNMSPDERKVILAVYMTLLIDDKKGVIHHGPPIIRRPNHHEPVIHSEGSKPLPPIEQIIALLDDKAEGDTPHPNITKEDSDKPKETG